MSSILKALKKVEGRKVERHLPSWWNRFSSVEHMDSRIRRSRNFQKILGILILIGALALAGKLYPGKHPAVESSVSKSVPTATTSLPEKSVEKTKSVATSPPVTSVPIVQSAREAPPEAPEPTQNEPETTSEVTITSSGIVPEATPETAPESAASSSGAPTAPAQSTPPTQASATTTQTSKTYIPRTFDPPPEEASGLSLQALVWSEQPEARFAVISGRLLHEGGSIDGNTVMQIEEEYVVMRTGHTTWKLK